MVPWSGEPGTVQHFLHCDRSMRVRSTLMCFQLFERGACLQRSALRGRRRARAAARAVGTRVLRHLTVWGATPTKQSASHCEAVPAP